MAASLRLISPNNPAAWTEAEIKQLAKSNVQAAMEVVIRKLRDPLFYHAMYIVKDGQEAYDLVQEVFIRAMRERRFFDEDFRMKAWLFRVTSNLCFNTVRNRKRRGALLEAMVRPQSRAAEQIDAIFEGEQRKAMFAGLDRMTEDHRQILFLRYYDDLSYAEIADVLEIKLGTVMSRLSRARCRLLEVMKDMPVDSAPLNWE